MLSLFINKKRIDSYKLIVKLCHTKAINNWENSLLRELDSTDDSNSWKVFTLVALLFIVLVRPNYCCKSCTQFKSNRSFSLLFFSFDSSPLAWLVFLCLLSVFNHRCCALYFWPNLHTRNDQHRHAATKNPEFILEQTNGHAWLPIRKKYLK